MTQMPPPPTPRREPDWPVVSARWGVLEQRSGHQIAGVVEDAGLLRAARLLADAPTVRVRGVYVLAGVMPITALGLALAEVAPLWLLTGVLVVPTTVLAVQVGRRWPGWGRRGLVGLAAGLVATAGYDVLRVGLVLAGVWADPIPGLGRLLLGSQAGWWVGYVWRYVADGAALGLAYVALPIPQLRSGLAAGGVVCAGLVGLLALSPNAQANFLPLTWTTAAGAAAGHLLYGGILGSLTRRWLQPPVPTRFPHPLPRQTASTPALTPHPADGGPNGAVVAAMLAAGIGCAVLGALTLLVAASPLAAAALSYSPTRGPLTGTTTLAVLVWILAWGNLHLRWAPQQMNAARALALVAVLVGIGLVGALGCGSCLMPVGDAP